MPFTNGRIKSFEQDYEDGKPVGDPRYEQSTHNATILPGRIHACSTMVRHDGLNGKTVHDGAEYTDFHKKICLLAGIKGQYTAENAKEKFVYVDDLNEDLKNLQFGYTGIPTEEEMKTEIYDREIKYFCAGKGGIIRDSSIEELVVSDPMPWETRLYTIIPFVMQEWDTDNNIPADDAVISSDYAFPVFMRSKVTNKIYKCFFLKKMKSINPLQVTKTEHDETVGYYDYVTNPDSGTTFFDETSPNVFNEEDRKARNVYVNHTIRLDIEPIDFRKYFSETYGTTPKPSWNFTEIGLVISNGVGLTNGLLKNAEIFSKLVMKPMFLDSLTKGRLMLYELYS